MACQVSLTQQPALFDRAFQRLFAREIAAATQALLAQVPALQQQSPPQRLALSAAQRQRHPPQSAQTRQPPRCLSASGGGSCRKPGRCCRAQLLLRGPPPQRPRCWVGLRSSGSRPRAT